MDGSDVLPPNPGAGSRIPVRLLKDGFHSFKTGKLRLKTAGRPRVALSADLADAFCGHPRPALVLMELGTGSEQDLLAGST